MKQDAKGWMADQMKALDARVQKAQMPASRQDVQSWEEMLKFEQVPVCTSPSKLDIGASPAAANGTDNAA